MKILTSVFTVIFTVFFSLAANAGWVSSGGESYGTEKNPWFLKNSPEIKYCLQIDSDTLSVNETTIREAVAFAFRYWKNQLALPHYEPGLTPVGQQTAVEQTDCQADTDLMFKFGYGTLKTDEIEFLGDTRKYIGVAIRKEYDTVNMKGRGVIYISSDRGPFAYSNSGHLIDQAWSKRQLLKYAIIHELGHVMGIAHTGVGVMSETFLTQLLNKQGWTFYASRPVINFARPIDTAEVCIGDLSNMFSSPFFKTSVDQKCLKLEKGAEGEWSVLSRENSEAEFASHGRVKISSSQQHSLLPKPLIFVYLPEEQKVFGPLDMGFTNLLVGALSSTNTFQGIYTVNGSLRPYHLEIIVDAESIQLSGIVGNEIKPVFRHALPGLKGIIFP